MSRETQDLPINLAPTGMVATRSQSETIPLTVDEIVADVAECATLGITSVHIHVRDHDGAPSQDAGIYAQVIEKIRSNAPDLVIGVSCSGRTLPEFEDRARVLDLTGAQKPDVASLTMSSLNFVRQASVNSPDTVRRLAERMREQGIKPELEIFDLGMVNYARYLLEKGVLEEPLLANLFFGNIASAQADLGQMGIMLAGLPESTVWSFAGIGQAQLAVNGIAIAQGGGVRVGLEDNLFWDSERAMQATNSQLVQRCIELGSIHGRKPMSPLGFRSKLGLNVSG